MSENPVIPPAREAIMRELEKRGKKGFTSGEARNALAGLYGADYQWGTALSQLFKSGKLARYFDDAAGSQRYVLKDYSDAVSTYEEPKPRLRVRQVYELVQGTKTVEITAEQYAILRPHFKGLQP